LLFIENITKASSTHAGPLDDESSLIQNELSQLNRLDCVTINSQPYEQETVNGIMYRARPFVFFYYPKRKINQLIQLFMYNNTTTLMTVYSPDTKVVMYNSEIYTELSNSKGLFPLHQDFINGNWVESYYTSFDPTSMPNMFNYLSHSNTSLLQNEKENLVLVNIVGMDFDNNIFTKLAHSAHAIFFS